MASPDSRPLKRGKFPSQGLHDPLEALPEDLIVRIFASISREKWSAGITVFPQVSKRWNIACNNPRLWEIVRLDFSGHGEAEQAIKDKCLFWLGQRLHAVKRLRVSPRPGEAFCSKLSILLLASRLEVLIVDCTACDNGAVGTIGRDALQSIARISSLQVLKLAHVEGALAAIHDLRHLGNLRELYLRFQGPFDDEEAILPSSLCKLSELRKLILLSGDPWAETQLALPDELSSLSKLEELSLPEFLLIKTESSSALLPPLPALKRLALQFEDDFADCPVKYPPSLTSLSLSCGGFCESLAACIGLQQLELNNLDLTVHAAHEVIALMAGNLKNLRRLDLFNVTVDDSLFQLTTIRVLHVDRSLCDSTPQAEAFWARVEVLKTVKVPKFSTPDQGACFSSLQKLDVSWLHLQAVITLQDIVKIPKCRLREVYLPFMTLVPEDAEKLFQMMNKNRKMEMHLGSPSRCGTKDPDLLPFEYDISPCYRV